MATEAGDTSSQVDKMSELSGASLLVIVGEPFTADHRELILERITTGLRSWDTSSSGCDLNAELQGLATEAPSGEEGPHGERVIEHSGEQLRVEVVVNATHQVVTNKLRHLLLLPAKQRYVLFAGHAFQGTGAWVLQDNQFTYKDFASIVHEGAVEASLKQASGGSLTLQVFAEGEWAPAALAKQPISKLVNVSVNPSDNLHVECSGLLQFTAYLSYFVKSRAVKELLQPSDVVGNIRFSRPTLYIFPGCQGDSSLFGISGFNLLINGGYSRKSCFWDFTRHLDRIDAMLVTHLGPDNLFGVSSLLQRKARDNVHPELGFVYMNGVDEAPKHSPNGDSVPEDGGAHKPASLLINLVEEGNKMYDNLRGIVQVPTPCIGNVTGSSLTPLSLYHKVGHGSLDMYVLNPLKDSKELKEFLSQWSKHVSNFAGAKGPAKGKELGIPLPDQLSVCALLVWKPSDPSDNITRILFPGSAPQSKIFEGLDKLKGMDIFQQAACSEKSLHAPKSGAGVKKPPAGRAAKPAAGRAPLKAEPRKPIEKSPVAKATSPPKSAKDIRNTDKAAPKKRTSPSSTKSSTPTDQKELVTAKPVPIKKIAKPEPVKSPNDEPELVAVSEPVIDTNVAEVEESAPPAAQSPIPPAVESPIPPMVESPIPPAVESPIPIAEASSPEMESESIITDRSTAEAITPDLIQQDNLGMDDASSPDSANLLQMSPNAELQPSPVAEPIMDGLSEDEAKQSLPESQQDTMDINSPPPAEEKQDMMVPDVVGSSLEEAAMPEADQTAADPVREPQPTAAAPVLESPEPLPDPLDFSSQQNAQPAEDIVAEDKPVKNELVDEEKDIDTAAESVPSPDMDKQELADLGIYDAPEADMPEPVPQDEGFMAEEDEGFNVDDDMPGAVTDSTAQPEADQGVFGGVAPEGLPSPHEPELGMPAEYEISDALSDKNVEEQPSEPALVSEPEPVENMQSPAEVPESKPEEIHNHMTAPPDAYADLGDSAPIEVVMPEANSFGAEDVPASHDDEDDYPLDDTSSVDSQQMVADRENLTEQTHDPVPPPAPEGFEMTPQDPTSQDACLIPPYEFDGRQDPDGLPDVLGSSVGVHDNDILAEDSIEQASPRIPDDDMPGACPAPQHDPFTILDAPMSTNPMGFDSNPSAINPFMGMGGEDDYRQPDLLGASDIPHSNGTIETNSQMSNPFDLPPDPSVAQIAQGDLDRDSLEREEAGSEKFDPLHSWGEPMGLPAPATPKKEDTKAPAKGRLSGPSKTGAGDAKKSATSSRTTTTKTSTSAPKSRPPVSKTADAKKEVAAKKEEPKKNGTVRKAAPVAAAAARRPKPSAAADKTKTETTSRPSTAPESKPTPRTATTKKTAVSSAAPTARAPTPVKLAPVTPCYVDLTYIPAHGDNNYLNLDFFRRIRARYYVLSSLNPSPQLLDALLEAKQTWENADLEVTLIPTYDTDTLHRWMNLHQDDLINQRITVAPSASRCTIQLQDHETSSPAYRLEF